MQLVGYLLIVAGAVAITGSAWPLVLAGVLLMVTVEVPGLVRSVRVRRLQRQIRDEFAHRRDAA